MLCFQSFQPQFMAFLHDGCHRDGAVVVLWPENGWIGLEGNGKQLILSFRLWNVLDITKKDSRSVRLFKVIYQVLWLFGAECSGCHFDRWQEMFQRAESLTRKPSLELEIWISLAVFENG